MRLPTEYFLLGTLYVQLIGLKSLRVDLRSLSELIEQKKGVILESTSKITTSCKAMYIILYTSLYRYKML